MDDDDIINEKHVVTRVEDVELGTYGDGTWKNVLFYLDSTSKIVTIKYKKTVYRIISKPIIYKRYEKVP